MTPVDFTWGGKLTEEGTGWEDAVKKGKLRPAKDDEEFYSSPNALFVHSSYCSVAQASEWGEDELARLEEMFVHDFQLTGKDYTWFKMVWA